METASILTLRLAEALGLYAIALGAGAIVAPARWQSMGDEMERSQSVTLLMGMVVFAIGALILGVHHSLADPLAAFVTIAAAIAAVKGLLLLAVPQPLIALARPVMARPRIWGVMLVIVGAGLLIAALTGHATQII